MANARRAARRAVFGRPVEVEFVLACALLLLGVVGSASAQHDASAQNDAKPEVAEDTEALSSLGDWIPSVSVGVGATMRDTYGQIDTTQPGPGLNGIQTVSGQAYVGFERILCRQQGRYGRCFFVTQEGRGINSMAIPVGAQLLSPPLPLPGEPRLLLHGNVSFPLNDRVVAGVGYQPADWDIPGARPFVRLELESETRYNWWAGLGAAIELPLDLAPERRIWLKLSGNYFEEALTISGIVHQFVGGGASETHIRSEDLTIRSAGVGVGLEALVYKWGPLGIGFGGDFLAAFTVSDTTTRFLVATPGIKSPPNQPGDLPSGPAQYTYVGDSPQYQFYATVRFSWLGR